MRWTILGVVAGLVLTVLELLRRRHAREHAADYMSRIQVLKADRPMALPVVKAPLAQKAAPVAEAPAKRTRRRRVPRPRAVTPVTPFSQRKAR